MRERQNHVGWRPRTYGSGDTAHVASLAPAFPRFVQLSKIDALVGSGTHAPSLIVGKNGLRSNYLLRRRHRFVNPTQCLSASKNFLTFFEAWKNEDFESPVLYQLRC